MMYTILKHEKHAHYEDIEIGETWIVETLHGQERVLILDKRYPMIKVLRYSEHKQRIFWIFIFRLKFTSKNVQR